jgi:hypothetical protein
VSASEPHSSKLCGSIFFEASSTKKMQAWYDITEGAYFLRLDSIPQQDADLIQREHFTKRAGCDIINFTV